MNRKIIMALIIIVLIILGGLIVFSHNTSKVDTQINFLNAGKLQSDSQVQFELKDGLGNTLENQNVTISFGANGQMENYTITTDSQGRGALVLDGVNPGNYSISVSYDGDEKHNGCSAAQTIIIDDGTASESTNYPATQTTSQSTSDASYSSASSASSSTLNYDNELNEHYDSNGKIVGGQNDGMSYDEVKNNQPQVDQEGNLV